MNIILTLLWIVLWNIIFVDIFKERFEKMLPFSLIGASFLLYLSGLIGSLKWGFYFTLVFILFYWVFKVYEFNKNKKWTIPFNNILTTGFYMTIVVYALIVGINWIRGFNHWDDYMHWGSMVKYNYYFDQFYCFDKSFIFAHKDYPPMASLYETIWCYLTNGYSETICIRAMQFLEMSFLLVIFSKIELTKNNIIKTLLSLFVMIIIVLVLPDLSLFYYNSIYVDSLIGIIFGYSLYFVFSKELSIKNSILLALLCSFLILLKQIGLAFYGLILFAILIKVILNYKKIKVKEVLIAAIIVIGTPVLLYLSWRFMVNVANVNGALIGQFSYEDLKIFDIFEIIKGTMGEVWQIETASKFIHALFNRPMFYKPFELSFASSLILINTIFFGICLLFKRKNLKTYFAKMLVYNIGAAGYSFGMLMLYVFAFGPYEGPILASFERYMATYILTGVLLVIFTVYEDFELDWKVVGSVLLITILFIPLNDYSRLKPSTTYSSWGDGLMPYSTLIMENIEPGKKVIMMEQGEKAIHHYIMGYYLMPIEMNAYSFGSPKYQDDIYSVEFKQEDFDKLVLSYDYFYIYMFDDVGNKLLENRVEPSEIKFSKLFEIKKEQGSYTLVPIN